MAKTPYVRTQHRHLKEQKKIFFFFLKKREHEKGKLRLIVIKNEKVIFSRQIPHETWYQIHKASESTTSGYDISTPESHKLN